MFTIAIPLTTQMFWFSNHSSLSVQLCLCLLFSFQSVHGSFSLAYQQLVSRVTLINTRNTTQTSSPCLHYMCLVTQTKSFIKVSRLSHYQYFHSVTQSHSQVRCSFWQTKPFLGIVFILANKIIPRYGVHSGKQSHQR